MGVIAITNTQHYQDIANSVRYSKEGTQYESDLAAARAEIAQDNTYFSEISTAIVDKDGGSPPDKADMAGRIESLYTPLPDSAYSDVNFFDYDGTLLYAYTFEEALALEELPPFPTHEGLVAQEWNYTLSVMKEYAQDSLPCDIGVTYTTDDGSTKFFFFVAAGTKMPDFSIYVEMEANQTATIYWGDGTSDELTNSSASSQVMSFNKTGYSIVDEDTELMVRIVGGRFKLGGNGNNPRIFNGKVLQLRKVYIGENVISIKSYAFCTHQNYGFSLEYLTISNYVNTIEQTAFAGKQLKWITFPKNIVITTFYNLLANCYSLKGFSLPDINDYTLYASFQYDYSIKHIALPRNLIKIDNSGLSNLSALEEITIPPKCTILVQSFANNICLQKIKLLGQITYIGTTTFLNCCNLTLVKFPKSVTTINGTRTFESCSSLQFIDLSDYDDPNNIPTLDSSNSFILYCPDYLKFLFKNQEMLDAFAAATNWSTFADKFQIKGGIT